MCERDVVVSGIGMVTALGATAHETAAAWSSGASARFEALAELAGTPLADAPVAVLPAFAPAERLGGRRMLKYMSGAAVLGCVAAREAALDADVRGRFPGERVGLYAGTGLAAASIHDVEPMVQASLDADGKFSYGLLGGRGLAATDPLLSFKILANMPPCLVSVLEGVKGPNLIFTPWEGQTGAALLEAWKAVAAGEVDCALAGAADSAAHPATFVYLRQRGLLQKDERPASAAAYVVFERSDTAARDGRHVYAHIENLGLAQSDGAVQDPLADRMGRSFAAAPALMLALACLTTLSPTAVSGVDCQEFRVSLRKPA